jgi:phosphogluconate dehydratase
MLLEAMGLHVPGAAFVAPGDPLREALTRAAVRAVLAPECPPLGELVDERAIVNAMVALLATGGSTNHLIHWVAVARAAGLCIDWDDFASLSRAVPLLARVHPNGSADVNAFQRAGGPAFVIGQLLDAGLMHPDARTVTPGGPRAQARTPALNANADTDSDGALIWREARVSGDPAVLRSASEPFSPGGGLKLLTGNLGRSVIKVSAVPEEHQVIEAPARVFDSQDAVQRAFGAGELDRDVVCVVRWQGPRANGMPELHKLTPALAVLQGKGFKVALLTDGRMSGASGQIPAAIHLSPEGMAGGPIAKLRDGDRIRLDAVAGTLDALVPAAEWAARRGASMPEEQQAANACGWGRELFSGMRRNALSAEEGACNWF